MVYQAAPQRQSTTNKEVPAASERRTCSNKDSTSPGEKEGSNDQAALERRPILEENPIAEKPATLESSSWEDLPQDFPLVNDKDKWTYPVSKINNNEDPWSNKPHLLIAINPQTISDFVEGYRSDSYFTPKYADVAPNPKTVITASQFQKEGNRMLYFIDADWNTRLCVPKSQINFILKWIHDSPTESAHAGYKRFLAHLKEVFFWPTMANDAYRFALFCDVCQKIKVDHRKRMGPLRPAHIPRRPFATVSLDLITGLPPSEEENYTAILVIVDKLTKFAVKVPTHDTLSQEGFAKIFVDKVANVYGLPDRIIADRDK